MKDITREYKNKRAIFFADCIIIVGDKRNMAKRYLHAVILTVVFPCFVSLVVYYGFATNYTGGVFHEAGFRAQYESGIYKYRVLGRHLLLRTHQLIVSQSLPALIVAKLFGKTPASLVRLDPQADAKFYAAYFVQNTFFMVLSCIVLYFLLPKTATPPVSGPYVFGVLLMGITQYVVCPYDTLSYSLVLLSFFLITRPFRFSFPILVFVLCASTLVRESAALTLSFYFAYHHAELMNFKRRELRQLGLLIGTFVVTYLLLRVYCGLNEAVWQEVKLRANLTAFKTWAGIMVMPVVSYMLCAGSRKLKQCLIFLAASLPYLLSMVVIANTWEIRIWVPIWLGLICLARDIPNNGVQTVSDNAPGRSITCS
jgi:hypothetical protein